MEVSNGPSGYLESVLAVLRQLLQHSLGRAFQADLSNTNTSIRPSSIDPSFDLLQTTPCGAFNLPSATASRFSGDAGRFGTTVAAAAIAALVAMAEAVEAAVEAREEIADRGRTAALGAAAVVATARRFSGARRLSSTGRGGAGRSGTSRSSGTGRLSSRTGRFAARRSGAATAAAQHAIKQSSRFHVRRADKRRGDHNQRENVLHGEDSSSYRETITNF
jgi:hypothetical protein